MATFSSEGDQFKHVLSSNWPVIAEASLKYDFKGQISHLKSDRLFFQGRVKWGGGGGGRI